MDKEEVKEEEKGTKKNNILRLYCIVALMSVVIVGGYTYLNSKIVKLESDMLGVIGETRGAVNGLYESMGDISESVDGITEIINNKSKNASSIMEKFEASVAGFYEDTNTVKIAIKGTPKELSEGQKISFVITPNNGVAHTVEAVADENMMFSAEDVIEKCTSVNIDTISEVGGKKRTENMVTLYTEDEMGLDIVHVFEGNVSGTGGTVDVNGKAFLYISEYGKGNNIKTAEFKITVNGITSVKKDMEKSSAGEYIANFDDNITVEKGNKLKVEIEAEDTMGYMYKGIVQGFEIGDNEELIVDNDYNSGENKLELIR